MKKILNLIFLIFFISLKSQDLNYNLLLEDKGDFYYAKRENLTDVWIKIRNSEYINCIDNNGEYGYLPDKCESVRWDKYCH